MPKARVKALPTAAVLKMLGAGARGEVLMVLGERSQRTMALVSRIPCYAERTVYRASHQLADVGIVSRKEYEESVPSRVVLSLTKPAGRELYDLVQVYADASLNRLPNGQIDAALWRFLQHLGDLWGSGVLAKLNLVGRSVTEIATASRRLSYHQAVRRLDLFMIRGLVEDLGGARRHRLILSPRARRGMGLIAGVIRWRHRYGAVGVPGSDVREAASALRLALPLVQLPEYSGKTFGIAVSGEKEDGKVNDVVWVRVRDDGHVFAAASPGPEVDSRVSGDVEALLAMVVDGARNQMDIDGDSDFVELCFRRLYTALWTRPSAAPEEE